MKIRITLDVEVHSLPKLAKHVKARLGNDDDYQGILTAPNDGDGVQEQCAINLVREAIVAAGGAPLDFGCEIIDSEAYVVD